MIKKILLIVIALVVVGTIGLYVLVQDELAVTESSLINNSWGISSSGDGGVLYERMFSFKKKGVVVIEIPVYEDNSVTSNGKYYIKNGDLHMKSFKPFSRNIAKKPADMVCKMKNADNSFLYSEKLICSPGKIIIYNFSKNSANGDLKKFGKYDAVVERKNRIAVWRLRIRSGPGSTYKALPRNALNNGVMKVTYTFKVGDKIKTVGRTVKKFKVGKFENYWYYIEYTHWVEGPGGGGTTRYGWVFGEGLK